MLKVARVIRVGVGQMGPAGEDKQRVVEAMTEMTARAADDGVQMLLFPELALTPFFPRQLEKDYDKWFDELPSPLVEPVLERARDAEMVVVLPYAERDGAHFYNSALVVDADGSIAGKYRKVHIPAYFPTDLPGGTGSFEKMYFRPSDDGFPVFETRYAKIGVQICYDRMFPEGSRALALKGAEVIFFPHNYATYGLPYREWSWPRLAQARAYENAVFAVVSNRVGDDGERHCAGRSMVMTPFGGDIVAEGSSDKEELLSTEIDLDDVAEARRRLPWWRDRRPEMYGELVAGPSDGR